MCPEPVLLTRSGVGRGYCVEHLVVAPRREMRRRLAKK